MEIVGLGGHCSSRCFRGDHWAGRWFGRWFSRFGVFGMSWVSRAIFRAIVFSSLFALRGFAAFCVRGKVEPEGVGELESSFGRARGRFRLSFTGGLKQSRREKNNA